MTKRHYGTVKKQGGISLIPDLWARIDEAAEIAGVPRNRVMETVLMKAFGLAPDSLKSVTSTRMMQPSTNDRETAEVSLP